MDALVAVRARIARAVLARDGKLETALGSVTLRPHQVEAVHRLDAAIDQYGGALLADAPGLGKTFVALAVARDRGRAVVAAPAALRTQWIESARRAQVAVRFVSLERLSRRESATGDERLLIIDEAHHLRNRHAAWYGRASTLALGRDVLLITATPVHNRREDRDALLALFLGARATTLTDSDLARIIVRRPADASIVPALEPVKWVRPPRVAGIAAALRRLPSPLPARDGREAAALVRQGLALAWASSVAALAEMLRRAVHRAAALEDALATGRWPTRAELRAWTIGDDASQLAFAALFGAPVDGDLSPTRAQLHEHRRGLDDLRALCARCVTGDTIARATWLERLVRRHDGECIVAFSRFESTVEALWRVLRRRAGVVAISARKVRSAGGTLHRREILAMLAGVTPLEATRPICLVLATDLLGEGMDLRRASVIVHLDQPWTPALAAQREGRAARLGAPHASVRVYAVRPPAPAERLLVMAARHHHKRDEMRHGAAAADAREGLARLVRPWCAAHAGRARIVACRGARTGWLAALRDDRGTIHLLAASATGEPHEDDALASSLIDGASSDIVSLDASIVRAVRRSLRRWLAAHRSVALAGSSAGTARRRVLALLDHGIETTPLHERAALQRRATRLRTALGTLQGVGIDRRLESAPRQGGAHELLDWLEAATTGITTASRTSRQSRRPSLLALLIVR